MQNKRSNITELPIGRDISDHFNQKPSKTNVLPTVVEMDQVIESLRAETAANKGRDLGLQTPWGGINRLTKGFHPGDLIILSAPPKTGKTTLALNISTRLTFLGHNVLFYCLEMRPERLAHKVIEAKQRKANLTIEDIDHAISDYKGLPLYFAHSYQRQSAVNTFALIKSATKKYALDFIVFDNIHFLTRSLTNVNEELGQIVQGFKLLAEELAIPIMAIAQPRKREKSDRDEIMRADDIKYSNAVHSDCDLMLLMHRRRIASKTSDMLDRYNFTGSTGALDPITLVRAEAHRFGAGGEVLLYFHGEYSRFDELDEERWE